MEAQILEIQELGLRTAISFSDRMQAPIGRLIHFGNLQKWRAKLATAELESAMTVYVIAQLKMTDRAAYDRYQARFFDVFRKFNGRLLSADESPSVVEGDWNRDKLVLMSFPDETAYHAWADSPEYLEISKDRKAGAQAIVLLAKGFTPGT